jgi:DNA-binding NarL/FixJ family response regulator
VTDDASPRIRVLIVDDDRMATAGIAAIFSTTPDIDVVGSCTDGDQVAEAVTRLRPQVVLCDVRMSRMDGIAVAGIVGAQSTGVKILMMTAFDENGRVLDAIAAGAAGFLLKDEDPTQIIAAIRHVYAGEAAFSPRAALQLTVWVRDSRNSETRRDAVEKMRLLTEREREFAVALVTGASDAELAAQFYVAETTIKSALTAIKTKWGVRNRTQVAVIVARAGLG